MKKILSLLSAALVVVAIYLGIVFRYDIQDWYLLRDYEPSARISALATDTAMTETGKKLFYINKPTIADKDTFNNHCRDNDHQHSIVLGCYLSGQRGIYLLEVDDERLDGIMEVTAAHEMLHAAYERLGKDEKTKIDTMLEDAFKATTNNRIKESIDQYRKQDPSVVNNELHSILGSEVRALPNDLEEYYSKYFTNRLKVVAYSEKYEQAFIDRRNAVRKYDSDLTSLKQGIEQLSSKLDTDSQGLSVTKNELNRLRNIDIPSYNTQVAEYNRRVDQYNIEVDELSSMVTEYNNIVQLRNGIASEEAELVQAIDSRVVVPNQH